MLAICAARKKAKAEMEMGVAVPTGVAFEPCAPDAAQAHPASAGEASGGSKEKKGTQVLIMNPLVKTAEEHCVV
jgi:hypothetical protein